MRGKFGLSGGARQRIRLGKAVQRALVFDLRTLLWDGAADCPVPQYFRPRGDLERHGREKAPAALCRKIAAADNGEFEIWGDGQQTRSFLYVSECVEGTVLLMRSGFTGPVNIGSEEMVTIDHLADLIMSIAGKRLDKRHIPGPLGVRGRNSDNRLIRTKLGWAPSQRLVTGLEPTYAWIERQVHANRPH